MIQTIDLQRHAVIEASAGTGKTFTIEGIVLRLLQEAETPLENILLVTFTEKATGELRSRLRSTLERTRAASEQPAPLVQAGLDQFDQAPIFTIHGFCQRLLQEYSLEKGADFRPELVEDRDLLDEALHEIQRGDWVRTFGERLANLLELAKYNRTTAKDWHERALALAKDFHASKGHVLIPDARADFHLLSDPGERRPAGWEHQLLVHTVGAMQRHLEDLKRQRGWQSFDDMIARVDRGLGADNPRAADLLGRLRTRFRYAIVDEFQDTDPLQWRIFRTLFLDGGTSKLMIVGDPKQAIYSFRGADLPTYLQAAQTMLRDFDAVSAPLQVNWRSSPGLLDALNRLFGDGKFFDGTGIQYVRVQPPEEAQRTTGVSRDDTGRTDLTLVDLRGEKNAKPALHRHAGFVAREVKRLLKGRAGTGKPALEIRLKNQAPRPIHPGDICILVFNRSEADRLTEAFAEARIPFSFYKQGGLWTSLEAQQVGIVLRALQNPEEPSALNQALLTPFFRLRPADLAQAGDLPGQHPARRLFQAWAEFADQRQWAALFQSLLERAGLPLDADRDPRLQRQIVNFRNLLETLEQKAYSDNLNLLGLLEFLQKKQAGHEGEARATDTEIPTVKIMTIHSSKGLEFPIVFLAGGFTIGKLDAIDKYRDDAGRLVFDLEISGKPKKSLLGAERLRNERAVAERASEKRRLLYVALTRAMFKLYVPFVGNITHHTKGPLVTLLAPALRHAAFEPAYLANVDEPAPAVPAGAFEAPTPLGVALSPIRLPQLVLPIDENLGQRRISVRSFTSLHRARTLQPSTFGDRPIRLDEIAPPTIEVDDPLRGAAFGDLVHNVLEKIDWPLVGQARSPRALQTLGSRTRQVLDAEIAPNLAKFPTRMPMDVLETSCRELVADLVWKSLHTPLPRVGPLWKLPAQDRLQELEFLFPQAEGPADRRREEGFFTGYMDLVFRVGGRYFILDWKTNLLPAYGPEELNDSMNAADYHRQYRLYWQALVRWLSRMLGADFDFSRHVGGAFYLYVRGLTGVDGSPGVFFHQPLPHEITLAEILER